MEDTRLQEYVRQIISFLASNKLRRIRLLYDQLDVDSRKQLVGYMSNFPKIEDIVLDIFIAELSDIPPTPLSQSYTPNASSYNQSPHTITYQSPTFTNDFNHVKYPIPLASSSLVPPPLNFVPQTNIQIPTIQPIPVNITVEPTKKKKGRPSKPQSIFTDGTPPTVTDPTIIAKVKDTHLKPLNTNFVDMSRPLYSDIEQDYATFFFKNNEGLYTNNTVYYGSVGVPYITFQDNTFNFTDEQLALIWKHNYTHTSFLKKWTSDGMGEYTFEDERSIFLDMLSTIRFIRGSVKRDILIKVRYLDDRRYDPSFINGKNYQYVITPYDTFIKSRINDSYHQCFWYLDPIKVEVGKEPPQYAVPGPIVDTYYNPYPRKMSRTSSTSFYNMLLHNDAFRVDEVKFKPYNFFENDPYSLCKNGFRTLNLFTGYQSNYINYESIPDFKLYIDNIKNPQYEKDLIIKSYLLYIEKTLAPIFKHIKEVWANNNEARYKWILDWFSWTLQKPRERMTALIIIGAEGCGKSVVTDWLMQYLYGYHLSLGINSLDEITGRFNSHTVDKVLTVVEELRATDSVHSRAIARNQYDKMKTNIMSVKKLAEGKFENQRLVDNYSFYILYSNYRAPIYAKKGSRRYMVFRANDKYKGNIKYFEELSTHFNQRNADMFYTYLLHNNITSDVRNAEETEELLDCYKNSLEPVEKFTQSFIDRDDMLTQLIKLDDILIKEIKDPIDNEKVQVYCIRNTRLWEIFQEYCKRKNIHINHMDYNDFRTSLKDSNIIVPVKDARVSNIDRTAVTYFYAESLDEYMEVNDPSNPERSNLVLKSKWFDPSDPNTYSFQQPVAQASGGNLQNFMNRFNNPVVGVLDQQINDNYNSMNYGLSVQGMNYKSN